jgi:hypothetical protein
MPSDYAPVVANLWFAEAQGMQLGVMAPGWLHGCRRLHVLLNRGRSIANCATCVRLTGDGGHLAGELFP